MPNSIPMSWLNFVTVCIRVSNFFCFCFCQIVWYRRCTLSAWTWDLLSLYEAVHFLGIWLSRTIVITNSNGVSAYLWNIPLWIFNYVKLFPVAINSTLQVIIVFSINFMTSSGILYILRQLDCCVVAIEKGAFKSPPQLWLANLWFVRK